VPTNPDLAEQIRTQPSARAARTEAGFHRAQQRADWFEVNIEVMDMVLHAKFIQHDDLRQKLLGTGNRELIEDSPVGVKRFSTPMLVTECGIGRRVLGHRKKWRRPERARKGTNASASTTSRYVLERVARSSVSYSPRCRSPSRRPSTQSP
jgi:hypothetical protein